VGLFGGAPAHMLAPFGRLSVTDRPGQALGDLQGRKLVIEVDWVYVLVEQNDVALLIGRHDDAGHILSLSSLSSVDVPPQPMDVAITPSKSELTVQQLIVNQWTEIALRTRLDVIARNGPKTGHLSGR
jgi:hypothetical protein